MLKRATDVRQSPLVGGRGPAGGKGSKKKDTEAGGTGGQKKEATDVEQERNAFLDRIAEQFEKMHGEPVGAQPAPASGKTTSKKRGRIAEEVEDKLMLKHAETETSCKPQNSVQQQPPNLQNGILRDYQLEGVR